MPPARKPQPWDSCPDWQEVNTATDCVDCPLQTRCPKLMAKSKMERKERSADNADKMRERNLVDYGTADRVRADSIHNMDARSNRLR